MIIPQPGWRTGFNPSPDIKATTNTNPNGLGTQVPVLSNP
jgi:hypothetical protein